MSLPSIPSFQLPAALASQLGAGSGARPSHAPGGASLLPPHYQGIGGDFRQRAAGHDPQQNARSLQQHFHAPQLNAFQGGQRPSHSLLARAGSLLSGLNPFQKMQGGMATGGMMAAGSHFGGMFGAHAPGAGHAGSAHGNAALPHLSMPEPHPGMPPHPGYGALAGGYQSRIQGYNPQHCADRLNGGFHLPGLGHGSHSSGGLGGLFGGKGLGKLFAGVTALSVGSSLLSTAGTLGAMAALGGGHGMMHGLGHLGGEMLHGMHGLGHFGHGMHEFGHFGHDMHDFGHFGHDMHDFGHFGHDMDDFGHFGHFGHDFDNLSHDGFF